MSASSHPVALRLEEYSSASTRLLALVMALPLIDGIFPALVLAGALDTVSGIIQVGVLIFGGSATVAVILSEMQTQRSQMVKSVLFVGAGLMIVAGIEAALAPSIKSVLNLEIFTRFAALVLVAIAAKTVSAQIGEYLPSPGTIILFGLIASISPSNAELIISIDGELIVRAVSAAGVGTTFALFLAIFAQRLRSVVDIDRLRFGSAVALGVLALTILSLAPETAAMSVLLVAAVLAIDPSKKAEKESSVLEPDGGTKQCDCTLDREIE